MTEFNYFFRLNLWLKERFPPINFISGFFLYLLAKAIVAVDQRILVIDAWDIFGLIIPACHLFLLRVLDEHKDFKSDAIYYPNRVLQKGLFTLKEVRFLGWGAFVLQCICYGLIRKNWISDLAFVWLWLWTGLMYKEFFCASWLKTKLFLYGFLHLLVTPFLILSLLSVCIPDWKVIVDWRGYVLPLLISIMTGWLYELSRKTKAPQEESGDLSYSVLWGVNRSLIVIYVSTLATIVLSILFFNILGIFNNYLLLIGFAIVFVCRMSIRSFRKNASPKARKHNEGVTLLVSLYAFLPPIISAFLIGG